MINRVTRRRVIGSHAAIGVITTASFALGLALLAIFGGVGRNVDAALFGSVLGYHLDVQSGPTIVLVGATLFAAAFLLTGRPGRIQTVALPR